MTDFNKNNIQHFLFLSGLILLVIGLPLGKFFINLAQGFLVISWLIQKDYITRIKFFFTNKITLFIFAVYALHIIGILYSSDIKYALDDVRKKIPLFLITFVISTSPPLSQKQFDWILGVFCGAVIASTLISFGVLHGIITSKKVSYPIINIRDISIFVSHIRLSLFCAFSICILFFYILQKNNIILKFLLSVGIVWLLFYMLTTASLTGIIILGVIIFAISIQQMLLKQNTPSKKIIPGLIVLTYVVLGVYIINIYRTNVNKTIVTDTVQEINTINGNKYDLMNDALQTEDGKRIYKNYCLKELHEQWPRYSKHKLDSPNSHGSILLYSLIRYMTSLDLNKDSAGLSMLKSDDIKNIENGCTNYRLTTMNVIEKRIYDIVWELQEYKNTGDANGHTLAQRYVYWTSGLSIIKNNWLFGIGTGDVQQELFNTYEKNAPNLQKKYYWRTHNQYLTICIALGLVGLLILILSLVYPLFVNKNHQNVLYLSFFVIITLSMLTEDTLETLAGISFYAFFNSLFLFSSPRDQVY